MGDLSEAEARHLWVRAVERRSPDGLLDASLELGPPKVLGVPGSPGLRTVFIPASVGRGRDTRGSFFFLLDGKGKITFGRFGHPKWSPDATDDEVAKLEPLFFFRVGSYPTTYLLATYWGPWESWGRVAIIDPARARIASF